MKPSAKNTIKRALVSVAVFAAIYMLSGPIIGWTGYDMNLKGIEFFVCRDRCRLLLDQGATKDDAVFAEILQKKAVPVRAEPT